MNRVNKLDINQILLDAHALGVKTTRERAIQTDTGLVVYKNGKIELVKLTSSEV